MRIGIVLFLGLVLSLGVACGGKSNGSNSNRNDNAAPVASGTNPAPTPTAGSSGASPTQPAAQPTAGSRAIPDSCTLLTDAQASSAMADVLAQKALNSSTQAVSVCRWDGVTTGRRFVSITVRPAQFGASVFNNSFKSRADGQTIGISGNEAVVIPGQNTPNDYHFLTGAVLANGLFIQVDVAGPNRVNADAVNVLTTVLQTVVNGTR